jgi:hypothetical protein
VAASIKHAKAEVKSHDRCPCEFRPAFDGMRPVEVYEAEHAGNGECERGTYLAVPSALPNFLADRLLAIVRVAL